MNQDILEKEHEMAVNAYIARIQVASELLVGLTEFVEDHGNISPDDVKWSNVSDMGRLVELLREAHSFIGLS